MVRNYYGKKLSSFPFEICVSLEDFGDKWNRFVSFLLLIRERAHELDLNDKSLESFFNHAEQFKLFYSRPPRLFFFDFFSSSVDGIRI